MIKNEILIKTREILEMVNELDIDLKVDVLNQIKKVIHNISPFKNEPVDFVEWVKVENVVANDYNPNSVAPPEMKLLELSIQEDGYTQPIVSWINEEKHEVVDGFHRNRVGRESQAIKKRIHGYLPLTIINNDRTDRNNRIASTIRHNRARGKHNVNSMSDIVVELKNRNWKNERISRELGMDEDEVLRLCQITGLSELFKDDEFSKSWDIKDSSISFEPLTDDFNEVQKDLFGFRTSNTSDKDRIFHTFDKWECHKAGFYNNAFNGTTKDECEKRYSEFLSNENKFRDALNHVISDWKHSCEHYLTNNSMNRIAWLGQASMCYATGIPAVFRSGFYLLSEKEQEKANKIALEYLNKWLKNNNREEVSMLEASTDKETSIY